MVFFLASSGLTLSGNFSCIGCVEVSWLSVSRDGKARFWGQGLISLLSSLGFSLSVPPQLQSKIGESTWYHYEDKGVWITVGQKPQNPFPEPSTGLPFRSLVLEIS